LRAGGPGESYTVRAPSSLFRGGWHR